VQTISVLDTPANKQLLLRGITPGSFTLDIEQQRNGSVTKRQTFTAIPSSTSTSVMLPLTSGDMLGSSSVAIDYDGNGSVDVRYEQSGEVVTYALVRSTISALALLPLYKNVLLQTLKIAEQHNQKTTQKSLSKTAERATLLVLKQQLLIYVKLKLLSPGDHQKIVNMVNVLISKLN
jgi:TfoX/Sxy family transcriptional regulator of competence genes